MRRAHQGVTLIELLCVILVIGILMGLLLGPISRAYGRAKKLNNEVGAGQQTIVHME